MGATVNRRAITTKGGVQGFDVRVSGARLRRPIETTVRATSALEAQAIAAKIYPGFKIELV